MIAQDIQVYLQSLASQWQYPADTVDTFKAGNPTTQARGIAVGWMSYTWALQRALELGCNVFITHEPAYYNHWDNDPATFRLPSVFEKRQFIKDNDLVIIRCHDLWDQIPDIGIPDSWGKLLKLGRPIDSSTYIRIYDAAGVTAGVLARNVARRTAVFGQPGVQLIGSAEIAVRRISIGTGAITPCLECVERLEIDLAICTDDGIDYWRDGALAIDMNIPIIVPVLFGLLLAILLSRSSMYGSIFFRTIFFMPQVFSSVTIALIWQWIYNPTYGAINVFLSAIGLEQLTQGWLGDSDLVLPSLFIAWSWVRYGFTMIIFIAAIDAVDEAFFDAAKVDGANWWQQFRHILLPSIRGALTTIILVTAISSFQVFDLVYVLTRGGPGDASMVIPVYMLESAFTLRRVGYGATVAIAMGLIIVGFSVLFLALRGVYKETD